MKTRNSIILCLLFFSMLKVNGQWGAPPSKVMLESGTVTDIMKEKSINIQYDYSSFAVGKFKSEAEYTKSKVKELNAKEKGKGDKWLEGWIAARKEKYEPKFEELINKVLDGKATYSKSPTAKYTLTVKTTFVEPGYNIGIAKYPSFVNFDFIYTETGNPDKVVAKLYVQNVIGSQSMGFDYDVASRVQESYAKAGKMLGKFMLKGK